MTETINVVNLIFEVRQNAKVIEIHLLKDNNEWFIQVFKAALRLKFTFVNRYKGIRYIPPALLQQKQRLVRR